MNRRRHQNPTHAKVFRIMSWEQYTRNFARLVRFSESTGMWTIKLGVGTLQAPRKEILADKYLTHLERNGWQVLDQSYQQQTNNL